MSEGGAALENGQLRVTWDACPGSGTLAVYRDGWPVLTQTVDCAAGGCLLDDEGVYEAILDVVTGGASNG